MSLFKSTSKTTMEITGHTNLVGIVANPVEHVRTPQLFNASVAQQGLDVSCVPFHVREPNLQKWLSGALGLSNLTGLIITIPYKEAVIEWCGELTDTAILVGSVNAMRRDESRGIWIGGNFDGDGFVAGLRSRGHQLEGKRVLLVGAGGAGKAMAYAIARSKPAELVIHNRAEQRAIDLVSRVNKALPEIKMSVGDNNPGGFDVVVNATSLGLKDGDALPIRMDRLESGTLICEAVMRDGNTPLLQAAFERGCVVHHGRHMLYGQIVEIAQFLGIPLRSESVVRMLGP